MLRLDKAKGIEGWMSDLELEFLAQNARESGVIIEVGSYLGRSTRALADNTQGIIYAIDPWSGPVYNDNNSIAFVSGDDIYNRFYCHLYAYIEANKVIICRDTFDKWEGVKHPENFNCDFLFIDGDHRYENVVNDIELALTFKPRIIAGHDYKCHFWPGVEQAVNEKFGSHSVGVEDTIWWKQLR